VAHGGVAIQRRLIVAVAVLIVVTRWGMLAQGSPPRPYSLTREAIDQIMPPGEGRDKEYRGWRLCDLQARKLYLKTLSDPAASRI
jgi:hypothetical protein